jgi:hypothetical protein
MHRITPDVKTAVAEDERPRGGSQTAAGDHAELKKNDYNISPSRRIHTSDAETGVGA